jgi:hypothetical protein
MRFGRPVPELILSVEEQDMLEVGPCGRALFWPVPRVRPNTQVSAEMRLSKPACEATPGRPAGGTAPRSAAHDHGRRRGTRADA